MICPHCKANVKVRGKFCPLCGGQFLGAPPSQQSGDVAPLSAPAPTREVSDIGVGGAWLGGKGIRVVAGCVTTVIAAAVLLHYANVFEKPSADVATEGHRTFAAPTARASSSTPEGTSSRGMGRSASTRPAASQPAATMPSAPSSPRASAKGSIRGTLTYYFNENYGDKPDVGAKVWVLEGWVQECPETWMVMPATDGTGELFYVEPAKERGRMYSVGVGVRRETIADGNGNFAIEGLPPGQYTVIFESAHAVHALSLRDCVGKHEWRWIRVEPGGTVDVSHDFGMTWG